MKQWIALGVGAFSALMMLLILADVMHGDGSMLADRLAVGMIAAALGIPVLLASAFWKVMKFIDA